MFLQSTEQAERSAAPKKWVLLALFNRWKGRDSSQLKCTAAPRCSQWAGDRYVCWWMYVCVERLGLTGGGYWEEYCMTVWVLCTCGHVWLLMLLELPECGGKYFALELSPLVLCLAQSQVHVEFLSHGFLQTSQVRRHNRIAAFVTPGW